MYLVGQTNGQAYESLTFPRHTGGIDYVDELVKGQWVNVWCAEHRSQICECGLVHGEQRQEA